MQLSPVDRLNIAAGVGSDLPLFLVGGTVLGIGRGEQKSFRWRNCRRCHWCVWPFRTGRFRPPRLSPTGTRIWPDPDHRNPVKLAKLTQVTGYRYNRRVQPRCFVLADR